MKLVASHLLAIMVAVSYLMLGVAQPSVAREVWWVYGFVSLVLATVNFMLTRSGCHGRRSTHGH